MYPDLDLSDVPRIGVTQGLENNVEVNGTGCFTVGAKKIENSLPGHKTLEVYDSGD